MLDDFISSDYRPTPALQQASSSSTSETTKRSYMSESTGRRVRDEPPLSPPMYTSTPISRTSRETREYNRELITDRNRSVTPPPRPSEALKTPPMIRKILQSSQQQQQHASSSSSYQQHQHSSSSNRTTTTSASRPPPVGGVPLPIIQHRDRIPNYDETPDRPAARYYTSSTTTEHRTDRELSPVRTFPSSHPSRGDGEPPKRLDELLATFGDHSYSVTTRHTNVK